MFDYGAYIKDYGHHWQGEDPDPEMSFGFIYTVLSLIDARMYIGKKQYKRYNRVKVPGKSRRRLKVSDNNWKQYTGSSKELNADIVKYGKEYFLFIILENIQLKGDLHHAEIELQTTMGVLTTFYNNGVRRFYNKQIAACKFIPTGKRDYSGENNPNYGKTHSGEVRRIIGEYSRSRGILKETRERMAIAARARTKVHLFIYKGEKAYIGSSKDFQEYYDISKSTPESLIAGKIRDSTCRSGYSNVYTRLGWSYGGYLGTVSELGGSIELGELTEFSHIKIKTNRERDEKNKKTPSNT